MRPISPEATLDPTDDDDPDPRTLPGRSMPGLRSVPAGEQRFCVLCGRPLRAGHPITRVHGSAVHAACRRKG